MECQFDDCQNNATRLLEITGGDTSPLFTCADCADEHVEMKIVCGDVTRQIYDSKPLWTACITEEDEI